ncbi:heme/copper-type cytochrome/quinol oxidase subunit 1 [Flavobacterium nitrogenifigens]|uniref:Heme/copper-type cytochrome/quinol oxidase subunit 1 n=2 Tax=Flavobacterium TaxID=237 RepID=A0A7W7N6S5_9FLAO|nr:MULTISPECIES: hypothetical protein [Flavobacterium]MBB4801978.1 heme/copper-type cytochrome/quinol oxidase subunit 1 [Flavobacterium nitrogenifigens]MBB6386936.1 heme/copper-type cytochrome/quinol oxidase subunit 1 [Flavobacterium notoginsengisoli]
MIFQKVKVYHLFWITALIILLIGICISEDTLDVNIHDTYFVIRYFEISIVLFTLYFLMGLGYWIVQKIFKKQLIHPLTVIHSFILIGSFLIYWGIFLYNKLFRDNDFPLFDNYLLINLVLTSEIFVILFIASPIYIANFMIAFLKKEKA